MPTSKSEEKNEAKPASESGSARDRKLELQSKPAEKSQAETNSDESPESTSEAKPSKPPKPVVVRKNKLVTTVLDEKQGLDSSASLMENMATKSDVKRIEASILKLAGKSDLDRLAKKSDVDQLPTKNDIERFASRSDMDQFATKSDVGKLASKSDLDKLKNKSDDFVTKSDLEALVENMATKADIANIEELLRNVSTSVKSGSRKTWVMIVGALVPVLVVLIVFGLGS